MTVRRFSAPFGAASGMLPVRQAKSENYRVNRRYIIAALLLLVIFGAAFAFYLAQESPLAADLSTETLAVGKTGRSYRLVVPHTLSLPCPVVFAFHGIGDSTDSMAGYSQLDRLAADNGFLLVYPAGRNAMWQCIDVVPEQLACEGLGSNNIFRRCLAT